MIVANSLTAVSQFLSTAATSRSQSISTGRDIRDGPVPKPEFLEPSLTLYIQGTLPIYGVDILCHYSCCMSLVKLI